MLHPHSQPWMSWKSRRRNMSDLKELTTQLGLKINKFRCHSSEQNKIGETEILNSMRLTLRASNHSEKRGQRSLHRMNKIFIFSRNENIYLNIIICDQVENTKTKNVKVWIWEETSRSERRPQIPPPETALS